MTLTGRKATWTVAALIASVCLNLFVAGVIVSREIQKSSIDWRQRSIDRMLETLPPEARPVAQGRFDAHGAELNERLDRLRDSRKAIAALIGQPEASQEQLRAAMAEMRLRSTAVQETMHQALAEAAAMLPPEVRRQWQPRWWTIR